MKEYTAKEMKLLKANPYTFKVTKNKLYFTIEFKEAFWRAYQAGMAHRLKVELDSDKEKTEHEEKKKKLSEQKIQQRGNPDEFWLEV